MKIALIAHGSRGDVQPMLALSWTLAARGHDVSLLAPSDAQARVRAAGIACAPLPFDARALVSTPAARREFARGDVRALVARFVREERRHGAELGRAVATFVRGADLVVATGLAVDTAAAVGAAGRVPVIPVYFAPVLPSSGFPSPFVSVRPTLGPFNRATHDAIFALKWRSMRAAIAALRRDLAVAPVHECYAQQVVRRGLPCVLAYSGAIAPKPRDWGPACTVTGNLRLPPALRESLGESGLPDGLARWLRAGPAPIFLGFGSMPVLAEAISLVRGVVARAGARVVVAAGWSELSLDHDDSLFVARDVDHTALFPRCAAVVHHGGAGTTHEGLRAGMPTLVCSVFGDQHFWGARCRALGVGETLALRALRASRLRDALGRVLTPEVRRAAATLERTLAAEDGLAEAVRIIESPLSSSRAFPE